MTEFDCIKCGQDICTCTKLPREPWLASPSSLGDFDLCEQLGVYRHRDRLEATAKEDAPARGTHLHAGLAVLWRGGEVAAAKEAARAAGNVSPIVDAALIMYERLYRQRIKESKVLLVEEEVVHPTEFYKGILDLVVDCGEYVEVVDHKSTTSNIAGVWQEQWRCNEQLAAYAELARCRFKKPAKVVVDAVQWPTGGGFKDKNFAWLPYEIAEETLQELWELQRRKAKVARGLVEQEVEVMRSTRACISYGRLCAFAPICWAEPGLREAKLQQLLGNGTLQPRGEQRSGDAQH